MCGTKMLLSKRLLNGFVKASFPRNQNQSFRIKTQEEKCFHPKANGQLTRKKNPLARFVLFFWAIHFAQDATYSHYHETTNLVVRFLSFYVSVSPSSTTSFCLTVFPLCLFLFFCYFLFKIKLTHTFPHSRILHYLSFILFSHVLVFLFFLIPFISLFLSQPLTYAHSHTHSLTSKRPHVSCIRTCTHTHAHHLIHSKFLCMEGECRSPHLR